MLGFCFCRCFYVESLIKNKDDLVIQTARVEVAGLDLTKAEVYAKFIAGEAKYKILENAPFYSENSSLQENSDIAF